MSVSKLNRMQAIDFLSITPKEFDNYHKSGMEFKGVKEKNKWMFMKSDLVRWDNLKKSRIVNLKINEYQECFEFALKMAYSGKGTVGTGIRGVRSEVQMSDDFIMGFLAEFGVRKFLLEKFGIDIKLDMEIHPGYITPQDIDGIKENGVYRSSKIGVAIKSSKWKSCWNIIYPLEYENDLRKSDVYIFTRVGLPSDHLFRVFRNHSFFKNINEFLLETESFNQIQELQDIPVWITGFSYYKDLKKVTEIPNQKFDGKQNYRYVKNVGGMRNSDDEWLKLIHKL